MIFHMRNRYLRGLVAWSVLLALITAFPFLVVYVAAVDTARTLKAEWLKSRGDRSFIAHALLFKSGEP